MAQRTSNRTQIAFSTREKEVLSHIALGYATKQIALELHISEQTVKRHMVSILRKLEIEPPTVTRHRSRTTEINWLSNQTELRRELAGQWVVIEGKRLIAHGQTLKQVLEESRALGIEHPFVVCLPEIQDEDIAVIA